MDEIQTISEEEYVKYAEAEEAQIKEAVNARATSRDLPPGAADDLREAYWAKNFTCGPSDPLDSPQ